MAASETSLVPWYKRVRRWGQTNLTERDPRDYDAAFWRGHWKRTRIQGVIVNAGGIVAYYPTALPLQYQAAHLGGRDLFGEIATAAREDGLAVLARMDSNRASEEFYKQHPDYFAVDVEGKPYRAQERYVACVNSPYYREYLPRVLREIIDRYHPEGFTDNSWSGIGRDSICYCGHCAAKFRAATGMGLPGKKDWEDAAYQQWIKWSYACRLEVWDLNNAVTQGHGGKDCLWLGMLSGNVVGQSKGFHDLYELGKRSKMILCDHQSRDAANGFEQNGLNGKLLHGISNWDVLIPESMAMYVRGERPFRVCANPAEEARMWMIEGFAGGISPWWHHIGARHEDRRQYATAAPLMAWHEANEQYLYNREAVAAVGIVWSQANVDFYGRDEGEERVAMPFRGWSAALLRARIPFLPVHAEQIGEMAGKLAVLILPDIGVLTDGQAEAIRKFAAAGGAVLASGRTGLYNEFGKRREDFVLGEMFGVQAMGERLEPGDARSRSWEIQGSHTYLRLIPELGDPPLSPPCATPRDPPDPTG